jgi:hypothetical protein
MTVGARWKVVSPTVVAFVNELVGNDVKETGRKETGR